MRASFSREKFAIDVSWVQERGYCGHHACPPASLKSRRGVVHPDPEKPVTTAFSASCK
jgi:hypothetical protein